MMVAEVIQLRPKRGRPSKADELAMELTSHVVEERRQAEIIEPALHKLELMAQNLGPAASQVYAAFATWHLRHERRWSPLLHEPATKERAA